MFPDHLTLARKNYLLLIAILIITAASVTGGREITSDLVSRPAQHADVQRNLADWSISVSCELESAPRSEWREIAKKHPRLLLAPCTHSCKLNAVPTHD